MVSAARKTRPPIAFMRVANRVWRTEAEARTKPSIDPQIPSGERMGRAASCSGVRRQRKLMCAARDTTQEKNQAGECGSHDVDEGLFRSPVFR